MTDAEDGRPGAYGAPSSFRVLGRRPLSLLGRPVVTFGKPWDWRCMTSNRLASAASE